MSKDSSMDLNDLHVIENNFQLRDINTEEILKNNNLLNILEKEEYGDIPSQVSTNVMISPLTSDTNLSNNHLDVKDLSFTKKSPTRLEPCKYIDNKNLKLKGKNKIKEIRKESHDGLENKDTMTLEVMKNPSNFLEFENKNNKKNINKMADDESISHCKNNNNNSTLTKNATKSDEKMVLNEKGIFESKLFKHNTQNIESNINNKYKTLNPYEDIKDQLSILDLRKALIKTATVNNQTSPYSKHFKQSNKICNSHNKNIKYLTQKTNNKINKSDLDSQRNNEKKMERKLTMNSPNSFINIEITKPNLINHIKKEEELIFKNYFLDESDEDSWKEKVKESYDKMQKIKKEISCKNDNTIQNDSTYFQFSNNTQNIMDSKNQKKKKKKGVFDFLTNCLCK